MLADDVKRPCATVSAVETDQDDGRAARWSKESKKSKSYDRDHATSPQFSISAGPTEQPFVVFRAARYSAEFSICNFAPVRKPGAGRWAPI